MTPRSDAAFEAFVDAYSTRLLRAAVLLCGDRHLAEDLVQTALMRTATHWGRARRSPAAYARAVLVNEMRDVSRRRNVRPDLVLVDEVPRDAGVADATTDIVTRLSVLDALNELPARMREVVVCRFWLDLSVAETASLLDLPEGTVKSYTSRGLERLRPLLSDETIEVSHGE